MRSHYKRRSDKQHNSINFNGEPAISGDTSDSDQGWQQDVGVPSAYNGGMLVELWQQYSCIYDVS